MMLDRNEFIIMNDDFLMFLDEYFGEEYGLGIHGIDNSNCWIKEDGVWKLNKIAIDEIKDTILRDGLYIQKNRSLLSTVRFNQIEDYLTEGYYDAGGIIVALPKYIKNSNGDSIFVGTPVESDEMEDRNYEFTSLSDMILTDFSQEPGFLDSMFVLAKYEKVDNKNVKLTINPRHIYFNGGLLPNEYFDKKKKQIMEILNSNDVDNLMELMSDMYCKIRLKNDLSLGEIAIVNTVKQFNGLKIHRGK